MTQGSKSIFVKGSEGFVAGMMTSGFLGMIVFACLSFILSDLLAKKGPGVYYSGQPFAVCDPDIVLYSLFLVGLVITLLGLGIVISQIRSGLSGTMRVALGIATSGLIFLFMAVPIIYGIEGRLFLLPVCR